MIIAFISEDELEPAGSSVVNFGNQMQLCEWKLSKTALRSGDEFSVFLRWRAKTHVAGVYLWPDLERLEVLSDVPGAEINVVELGDVHVFP